MDITDIENNRNVPENKVFDGEFKLNENYKFC